jgi:hypothetical protein
MNVNNTLAHARQAYSSDMFLGFLTTYYVPSDLRVSIDDWIVRANASGLKNMTPSKPRSVDAFKRATAKAAENRRIRDVSGDFTYKFLVRDAGSDKDAVCRSLIVEQLDSQENRLMYGQVVQFRYDRKTEKILDEVQVDFLCEFPEGLQRLVHEKREQVKARYHVEAETLNDIKVRELIKDVLVDQALAVPVRPVGQPYFVVNFRDEGSPYVGNYDRLEALDVFINGDGDEDQGIPGCTFHWAPLVDDTMQRGFVRQSFLDETTDSVGTFMDQMAKMIRGERPLTEASVDAMLSDYEKLGSKVEAYQEFLEDELLVATKEMEIMFKQVVQLQRKQRGVAKNVRARGRR